MDDIAEKYRDKLDPDHKMAMDAVFFAAQLLDMHVPTLTRFRDADRSFDTIGPILDPTLYRDALYSKTLEFQRRAIKAAVEFHREIDAVRKEWIAQQAGDAM